MSLHLKAQICDPNVNKEVALMGKIKNTEFEASVIARN